MHVSMIVIGILLIFIVILFYSARLRMKNTPLVADDERIITLTDKNFQHQINDKLILVDFWAAWCAPCRMMAPVLNELAGQLEQNQAIGKLNIEQYQSLAGTYHVRSIPTMILFKNGKEINRFVGIKSKEFLLREMNKEN